MTEQRYAFITEWFDAQASLNRKYQLMYYADGTLEMYDVKNRRTFLKRTPYPSVTPKDLYIGSTVTVYSRQLKVVDYADDYTRTRLAKTRNKTLALVKPHAFENVGAILDAIQQADLIVENLQSIHLTQREAEEFYIEHRDRPFYGTLVEMMCSEPIVALSLVGNDCVNTWRKIIGPTDPRQAAQEAPGSIRAQFGVDVTRNAVHGSDSDDSARREIDFFFGRQHIMPNTALFNNCTLAIIKPHAVVNGHAGKIIHQIFQEGFDVSAIEMFHVDRACSEEFYEVYRGVVPEYSGMVEQLTSGPVIAIEVRGENVVPAFRELAGPSDPEVGRHLRPKSIRALFGSDKIKNAVHCTDLPEDGTLEVEYFFKILHDAK